jgi:hypothetical protein
VAFARLLQEQERAFYERRVANAETPRREYGGDDDETDCAYDDDDNDETSDADLDANDPRSSLGGSPETCSEWKTRPTRTIRSPVRARATRTRL